MERFFRIKEHSKLYDDYFQWVEAQENIGRIYDAFAKEWEIEASEFIPGKDRLSIIPTEKDNDKFQCEFTVQYRKEESASSWCVPLWESLEAKGSRHPDPI